MAQKENTIIVTGGLGFIGSHFIELALEKGFDIVNIDKVTYASDPNINSAFKRKFPEKYVFIKKDINDLTELPDAKYLVHFAAESHVDNSIKDGGVFIKSNVLGTQNLLSIIAQKKDKPEFIHISTDEVFGDTEAGFFQESDNMRPSNPYAASKAAAEMVVLAYGRTYGIPYKITRTTNNYGSRQHPEKLIPRSIVSILKNEPIPIHGTGKQVRNWIHVKDNVRAIYDVMIKGKLGESYHIASEEELSVNQIAKTILDAFEKSWNAQTVQYVPDRSGQDIRYALDFSKIRALGWAPQDSLKQHIEKLIRKYDGKLNQQNFLSLLVNRLVWPK
ncbi:MAG: GDP-mannose 4,6-dehydratase [Patescibacteria group bacterium]